MTKSTTRVAADLETFNQTEITAKDVVAKAGRKNILINGAMQVSQRGDYASAVTAGANTYYVDRWMVTQGAITSTLQNTSVTVDGMSSKAIRFAATSSATQFMGVRQFVEFVNIPIGKMLTVSAFVRTNSNYARFRTNTFGGSASQSPVFPSDGQWNKVSWTFDSTGTTTYSDMFFCIYGDAGLVPITSGDYIEVAQVQLELGSVATDFEHRSYGEELALCQRYYCQSYESGVAAGSVTDEGSLFRYLDGTHNYPTFPFQFITPMRSTPSMSIYNNVTGAANEMRNDATNRACGISAHGTKAAMANISNITVNVSTSFRFHYTANAELY